ncbi:IS200/IS605 family transposase [Streptomyces sp. NPDC093982]|uniref:IS200/IS605 family transposase n=1 Tax=Streptomyces sp. NPDC093982 TaxID=3155077 RepID=UPI003446430E
MELKPRYQHPDGTSPPNLRAHLVFVTKSRRGIIDDDMLKRREEVMRAVCADFETELGVQRRDRPRVLPAENHPAQLINSLKGVSSRRLRAEYTGRINRIGMGSVFWSRSYFAGSCGGAPLTVIRQYIEQQKRPL